MNFMEQGAALLGAGRFHEALQQFNLALRQDPASLEARIGLVRGFVGAGDPLSAAAWLSDARRVAPQALAPAQMLAELLLGMKQYQQALPVYEEVYQTLGARDRATLLHYGFCLEQTGALEQSVVLYREAIAQEPDFMEAHVDLAGVLWRLSDFEGALVHARKAAELAPQHAHAVRILGTALLNLNRLDEAEVELRRALALQSGFPLAEIDLAFVQLLAGKLEEGWRWYARRWSDGDRLKRPVFFRPELEWKGPREQPLQGKRIVLYAEQGLGDVIQFIRYVRLLQEGGATVFGVFQPALVPLLEHSIPGLQCLKGEGSFQTDYHAALLDLPMHHGTTLANIPGEGPYLRAPEEKADQWRERLAPWDGKLKVGIAWSGFLGQVNNRNRAMPLSELKPLLKLRSVQYFSLQKADAGEFTDVAIDPRRLVDLTGEWQDFSDSAAMLQNLDLVITVDTVIAHLAGALGRPAWVMLAPNADWRWLLERDDSPWYPTLKLFRRGFGEGRDAQIDRVAVELKHERQALLQHAGGPGGGSPGSLQRVQ